MLARPRFMVSLLLLVIGTTACAAEGHWEVRATNRGVQLIASALSFRALQARLADEGIAVSVHRKLFDARLTGQAVGHTRDEALRRLLRDYNTIVWTDVERIVRMRILSERHQAVRARVENRNSVVSLVHRID